MRCYFKNGISCGTNRRDFEDQSVIKGKLDQIGIRPIRVTHFGEQKKWRDGAKEEEEEKKESQKMYGLS